MRLAALNVSERGECYAIETPYYEGTGVHVERAYQYFDGDVLRRPR